MSMQVSIASDNRKKAIVVSHERSGTHFLMNTLAENFGYVSYPFWNLDYNQPINLHDPSVLSHFLKLSHNKSILNILKSHHPIEFFQQNLAYLCEQFFVFYIFRDPRDVLVSYRKLINYFPWDEGPKTDCASEFIRSEPRGAMLRYQKQQEPNVVQRWRTHVKGWLDFSQSDTEERVFLISYEDLDEKFELSVKRISSFVSIENSKATRPSREKNVIGVSTVGPDQDCDLLTEEDNAFIQQEAGDVMARVGYT